MSLSCMMAPSMDLLCERTRYEDFRNLFEQSQHMSADHIHCFRMRNTRLNRGGEQKIRRSTGLAGGSLTHRQRRNVTIHSAMSLCFRLSEFHEKYLRHHQDTRVLTSPRSSRGFAVCLQALMAEARFIDHVLVLDVGCIDLIASLEWRLL